jgi:thymidylate synthase
MMVARHCGYRPGKFTHFVANEQIYDRHIEQANIIKDRWGEAFQRELDANNVTPMLVLNPDKNNFYDFTIDDFTMLNYDPIKPQVTLELGI